MQLGGKSEEDRLLVDEWVDPAGGEFGIVDGQFVRCIKVKEERLIKPLVTAFHT